MAEGMIQTDHAAVLRRDPGTERDATRLTDEHDRIGSKLGDMSQLLDRLEGRAEGILRSTEMKDGLATVSDPNGSPVTVTARGHADYLSILCARLDCIIDRIDL